MIELLDIDQGPPHCGRCAAPSAGLAFDTAVDYCPVGTAAPFPLKTFSYLYHEKEGRRATAWNRG